MRIGGWHIAIAILLALAAGFLGAYAARQWNASQPSTGLHDFVHDELDLTSDQKEKLSELESRFIIERAQLEQALRSANVQLARAINQEHRYGPEVSVAIDHVHARMGDLQKASVRHVFAMRSLLDQEQRTQFDEQVSRSLSGTPTE